MKWNITDNKLVRRSDLLHKKLSSDGNLGFFEGKAMPQLLSGHGSAVIGEAGHVIKEGQC